MEAPTISPSLNFFITALCFYFAYLLHHKGEMYHTANRFIFCLGMGTFLAGNAHYLWLNKEAMTIWVNDINHHLPTFFATLNGENIANRMWYLNLLFVGLTGFFFVVAFVSPHIQNPSRVSLLKKVMGMLTAIFIVLATLWSDLAFSTDFFFSIVFNCICLFTIILTGLFAFIRSKVWGDLGAVLLCLYGILVSCIQQLMSAGIMPQGFLNYNDWFHIGMIIFVIAIYLLMTKTPLLQKRD